MSKEVQDIINKAILLKETNLDASKALILTAKALFPKNFEMLVEKNFPALKINSINSFLDILWTISFTRHRRIAKRLQKALVTSSFILKIPRSCRK